MEEQHFYRYIVVVSVLGSVGGRKPLLSWVKTGCEMEGSRGKKPLTGFEKEGMWGSIDGDITGKLSKPKRAYSSSSSSSSSKPPLGATSPFRLILKQPHSSSSHTLETAAANTKEYHQHQEAEFAHKNIALSDASDGHHDGTDPDTDQQESTEVSRSSDPRMLKRVSNRNSARRSRLKRLQRVAGLERQCGQLQNQIAILKQQVEAFANHKNMLILEQNALKQRLAAMEKERLVKQAEIERNQAEVFRLREIEKRQREKAQAQAMMAYANWGTVPNNQFASEQMFYGNIPAQGYNQNIKGTSAMEVDEQTVNLNMAGAMNELNAFTNSSKLSDKQANPQFHYDF